MLTASTREITETNTPFLQAVDVTAVDPTGGLLTALLPPGEATSFLESTSKTGLNALDYGIKAGLRYEWESLGINVNYLYGIPDFQTASKSVTDNHQYLQLTLNYNFGLGK
jgi:hypothetical protein